MSINHRPFSLQVCHPHNYSSWASRILQDARLNDNSPLPNDTIITQKCLLSDEMISLKLLLLFASGPAKSWRRSNRLDSRNTESEGIFYYFFSATCKLAWIYVLCIRQWWTFNSSVSLKYGHHYHQNQLLPQEKPKIARNSFLQMRRYSGVKLS